jgi:undecaprenyl-diphosphatase
VERFFQRHGGKTIVIGRFIGFLRAMGPFVAGASRVPYGRFLAASILGSGVWAATFVTLGYVFWRSFDRALEIAKQGNVGIGAVLVLAAVLFGAYRLKKDAELRQRARRWVAEQLGRVR